jgi:hypothetical protein
VCVCVCVYTLRCTAQTLPSALLKYLGKGHNFFFLDTWTKAPTLFLF